MAEILLNALQLPSLNIFLALSVNSLLYGCLPVVIPTTVSIALGTSNRMTFINKLNKFRKVSLFYYSPAGHIVIDAILLKFRLSSSLVVSSLFFVCWLQTENQYMR